MILTHTYIFFYYGFKTNVFANRLCYFPGSRLLHCFSVFFLSLSIILYRSKPLCSGRGEEQTRITCWACTSQLTHICIRQLLDVGHHYHSAQFCVGPQYASFVTLFFILSRFLLFCLVWQAEVRPKIRIPMKYVTTTRSSAGTSHQGPRISCRLINCTTVVAYIDFVSINIQIKFVIPLPREI